MSTWDAAETFDTAGTFDDPVPATTIGPPPPVVVTLGPPVVASDTWELWQATRDANEATGVTDADQGWPWLRLLDGLGQVMQRVDDLARDTPAGPGWSQIVDVTRAPTCALPWLAQLVGVRFDQTQTTDGAQRAAIQAEQGFTRGTPAALQAAAAKWLLPGQMVTVYERDTSPYHLTVVLTLGQLTGGPYSQVSAEYPTYEAWSAASSSYSTPAYPQAQITAALMAQKPAGLVMNIEIAAGVTYGTLTDDFATYEDLTVAYPSYALLTTASS